MRIALDAMGGDHAPAVTVAGAILAAREYGLAVALVGREEALRTELAKHNDVPAGIDIVPASEVIEMHEHPASAVRAKRDASIVVAMRLVRHGEADACVAAGNTGAAMAAGLLVLGRIRGVERPAIGALVPRPQGGVTLALDVGANAECRPSHMLQFAHMGSAYLEHALGIREPRIGLLSIGEEATKGSPLVQEVHGLLLQSGLNFAGNVEGRDLFKGVVDVIVTDGFTGNVVLKTAEGVLEVFQGELRSTLTKWHNLPAAAWLYPSLNAMRKRFDYSEHGGAPLLGVKGVVIIGHGRSDARAIASSLRVAAEGVRSGMIEALAGVFAGAPAVAAGDAEDDEGADGEA